MNEVAYYDKGEASLDKQAKTFQNFTYDNQSNGGVLNKLSEIEKKINDINNDIQTLSGDYNTLVNKYEKFSNYKSVMNKIITTMTNNVDAINRSYGNVVKTATQAINEHMSTDSTLMSDLDQLNRLLANGSKTN